MDDVPDDMLFPSVNQFKLMRLMYPNKIITFENQKILRQKRCFRREMKKLANWKRVEIINGICMDSRHKIEKYKLTFNGGIFFEFLLNYHDRNKEFYEKN